MTTVGATVERRFYFPEFLCLQTLMTLVLLVPAVTSLRQSEITVTVTLACVGTIIVGIGSKTYIITNIFHLSLTTCSALHRRTVYC
jgi:hypothetical protein